MNKLRTIIGIIFALASLAGGANAQEDWTLVWQDEFDGVNIDRSKWDFDIGNGFWANPAEQKDWVQGWGNNELQYYTDRAENASLKDGTLRITARSEAYTGDVAGKPQTLQYTSAKLKTRELFSKKYGKFEARIKLPVGKGFWPAFWMLPQGAEHATGVYGGWAASGEIDIMESWGSKPQEICGTLHYGGQWPDNKFTTNKYTFPAGSAIDAFHVYGIEWEPGEIRWYVDGELYATQQKWFSQSAGQTEPNPYPAPFDQPFYLMLNLAVGGNFDGNPDAATSFPGIMEVDFVRVYELTGRSYRTIEKQS